MRGCEYTDKIGQLAVGVAELEMLPSGDPDHQPHILELLPTPAASIEGPKLIDNKIGDYRIALGQTHSHTNISVCARDRDRDQNLSYRFMQDVQHCDFGGNTDHCFNMWHTEMLITRKLADYYYFPGEFVAFPAYEWTGTHKTFCAYEGGPFGHVNPLYLEEDGDLDFYSPADPECAGGSLPRLWESYRGKKIVTPPHHVMNGNHPYNWNFFDPTFIPVIEIFQDIRGSGEQVGAPGVKGTNEEAPWALGALKEGKRFGFIASGDHTGICRAGIFVKELTRTGLYEGLMARRCFATTSIPLRLNFRCNGEMMGSEVECENAEFAISVDAPETIKEVQIVRNGENFETVPVGAKEFEHSWNATRENSGEFWYCRVIFENGEIVWSSPIWLL